MNSPKGTLFSVAEQEVAAIAKAHSHPARVAIIRFLASRTTCTCGPTRPAQEA